MDYRIERTKRCITNSFIELRKKKDLEKITVKELSELALINKATFYHHYKDIYDLEEQLEKESVEKVLNSMIHPEYLISRSKEGIIELINALESSKELFNILFSDSRQFAFIMQLEKAIKKLAIEKNPDYKNNLEKDILLTVLIQGASKAFFAHTQDNFDYVIEILANISDCLLSNYKPIANYTKL